MWKTFGRCLGCKAKADIEVRAIKRRSWNIIALIVRSRDWCKETDKLYVSAGEDAPSMASNCGRCGKRKVHEYLKDHLSHVKFDRD